MKDPTRIPEVIALLQRAWEAQPDRTLAEIWGSLENRGLGWATADGDLVELLRRQCQIHPAVLRQEDLVDTFAVVETESPRRKVTIDPVDKRVTVRSPDGEVRTTSWCGGEIARLVAGAPLLLRDSAGIDHRIGVVRETTVHPRPADIDLSGVLRRELEDRLYGLIVAGGEENDRHLVVLGHSIEVFTVGLRTVDTQRIRFERIDTCRPGTQLSLTLRGGRRCDLGEVMQIFPLDA